MASTKFYNCYRHSLMSTPLTSDILQIQEYLWHPSLSLGPHHAMKKVQQPNKLAYMVFQMELVLCFGSLLSSGTYPDFTVSYNNIIIFKRATTPQVQSQFCPNESHCRLGTRSPIVRGDWGRVARWPPERSC